MTDDLDPLEGEPDPTADTPEADPEDTADDADSDAQPDFTPKDRSEATRKITELAQQNAQLRAEAAAARSKPADTASDQADPEEDDYLEQQNALIASELYGEEVTAAADAVWPLLTNAVTTADYMAALEAYHAKRSAGLPPADAAADAGAAAGTQSRADAVRPRVDTNRTESPDSDKELEAAKKSGKLEDFVGAATRAMGFKG